MEPCPPKDRARLLEILPDIPLLAPLTPEQGAALADAATVRQFSKGQTVFEEGATAQGFYILLQGLIKIFHITPDGKEMVLHLIRPCATFGEVPVFKSGSGGSGMWPAAAAAVQPSRALYIPGPFFLSLIRNNPELALRMLGVLAQRLYMFTRKLEAQSSREAPQRLAAYILHRSRLEGGTVTITLETARETLANMLGTARETLSRALGKLADMGAIEVQGRRVLLRDTQLLQGVAEGRIACD